MVPEWSRGGPEDGRCFVGVNKRTVNLWCDRPLGVFVFGFYLLSCLWHVVWLLVCFTFLFGSEQSAFEVFFSFKEVEKLFL